MAKPTSLPLYKTTTEFNKLLCRALESVPKPYKFEVARDIRTNAYSLLLQIQNINKQTTKEDRIKEQDAFIDALHNIEVLVQFCTEMNVVPIKGPRNIYTAMNKEKEVEKQICKWRTYTCTSSNDGKPKGDANSNRIDKPHKVKMLSDKNDF